MAKKRTESVQIEVMCDLQEAPDCRVLGIFEAEYGEYAAGWRSIEIVVFNKYHDQVEACVCVEVCPNCLPLLTKELRKA